MAIQAKRDATDAARTAVFTTVELMEQVLLALPFHDLYRVQRVSRHWKTVLATSVLLQEEMFLRAIPPPHKTITRTEHSLWREHMDSLVIKGPPRAWPTSSVTRKLAALNPIFEQLPVPSHPSVQSKQAAKLSLPESLLEPGDPRHGQFVTNPPCEQVDLVIHWNYPRGGRVALSKAEGIKIGDLVKVAALRSLTNEEAVALADKGIDEVLEFWRAESHRESCVRLSPGSRRQRVPPPLRLVDVCCDFDGVHIDDGRPVDQELSNAGQGRTVCRLIRTGAYKPRVRP